MRNRSVDLILVSVIVISVLFIGYRMLSKRSDVPGVKTADGVSVELSIPQAPRDSVPAKNPLRRSQFGYRPQAALAAQPKLDAATWAQLISTERLTPVESTAACRGEGTVPDVYYSILAHELEVRILQNDGGLLARFGGKKCHRKGQSIRIYSFGDAASEFYVNDIGEYTVTDIVEFTHEKTSEKLWSALGTTGAATRGPYPETTLLKVTKKSGPKKQDGVFPDIHFRYTQLKESDTDKLKALSKAVAIDLRSASARTAHPITDALIVDFPSNGVLKSEKFRWDVKIQDLDQTQIKMGPILNAIQNSGLLSRVVVIIGNGPEDGRPYWLLRELSILNFEKVYWYNGPVETIKPVFQ